MVGDKAQKLIFPMIRELQKDKSWRVRYMVANHFSELCDTVPKDVIEADMTQV
jgi:serine/threonine-protein phosphatase 2A regulatory subunit A